MRFGHRGPRDGESAALRELGDEQLAEAVRTGTERAFGVLWDRHAGAGLAAARRMTAAFDPEDLVQEAYLRIWNALLNGNGPDGPFRPYLYQTLRNIAASWSHRSTDIPVEDLPEQADPRDLSDDVVEGSVAMHAFRALPERWQSVLWYVEVEEMRPREAAPLLGLSASATAALAYRAREGLRRAWLQAHVNVRAVAPACRWSVERMGDFLRGSLSREVHHKVRRHVAECADCTLLVGELGDVSSRLRVGLLPLFLGAPALAAKAGLGGTAAVGVEPGSGGAGIAGIWRRVGRFGSQPVRGVVGGLALTAVVGAVAWAGSVVLGGPSAPEQPDAAAVVSSGPASPAGPEPAGPTDPAEPITEDPAPLTEPSPEVEASPPDTDDGTTGSEPAEPSRPQATPTEADPAPGVRPTDAPADATPPPDPPVPTPTPTVVSPTPTPTPSPTGTVPTPAPSLTPTPAPSPTPTQEPLDPPVLGSTTPRGTVAVFPRTSGEAPAGTLVSVTDASGTLVNTLTVDDSGTWDLTLDGLGTGDHGSLTVTQAAPDQQPVVDTIGPYEFDLPRIVSPADGDVLPGRWVPGEPPYTVDVAFDGTAGNTVQAAVDGAWTGNVHTLADEPLGRVVHGLEPGEHTLGLRMAEDLDGDEPRYGPTTTVTFTVVSPFEVAGAVPAYP
ncbi:hypothetical protein GCM10009718_27740 [Isoptericola halotolerans]|uniref:RNA polymerase sigma factor (Sigma-70 family) n=1 Tax=Isoptericola halotolerans TaxID=300560 RepID=A0ABX2A468_9MICO|nr:sigma-70 family RNA polymerase sigma factor [Isoptericola halotolerans]NOV97376.1 RNA polymerase sigma factor (sigma-70 family) [Isoptericola halotolerans]